MSQDTIVVGAGVAGLRCAGELQRSGRGVLVLERARDVGGRCATRRFEGQPVDFGPMFLHGRDPGFLAALAQVEAAGPLRHWPGRVEGHGLPCQPGALEAAVGRVAYADGVKAFPRHLARALDVRLETNVTALRVVEGGFQVTTADGETLRCRDLVLALALEQSRRLLKTLQPCDEVAGVQALLGMFASLPCLTLIAGYPASTPAPDWDLSYPEGSELLQLVAVDSSKRRGPAFLTLVAQARPRWSRKNLEAAPETWGPELLAEVGALLGPWALQPLWTHAHRWRYARTEATSELAHPIRLTFPGGQHLGVAGDMFAPGGGVQAAWLSGTHMAERILEKEYA